MTTDKQLLPCPFCGHETAVVSDNSFGLVFTVNCGNGSCRASGPRERCAADAGPAWNARVAPMEAARPSLGEDVVERVRGALKREDRVGSRVVMVDTNDLRALLAMQSNG
jgi:hypothetical protein